MRTSIVSRQRASLGGLLFALIFACTCSTVTAAEKQLIGWIETVVVSTEGAAMVAKIDTGADFSSLNAEIIRNFRRNQDQWLEFSFYDQSGTRHTLEREVQRTAKIKLKRGGYQARPVVTLQLCLGDSLRAVSVNLAQRGHFKYPLLLGRNFLSGYYIVDPGQTNLLMPHCQ